MALVWKNGKLIDTEIGRGLGGSVFANTANTPTVSTELTPMEMYFGKDANKTSIIGDTPQSIGIWGNQGFGLNQGTMQGLGTIGNLASGLAGAYLGSKQLGLAKDKFAFDKDMLTKQYEMAKDVYDRQVERTGNIDRKIQAGKAVV